MREGYRALAVLSLLGVVSCGGGSASSTGCEASMTTTLAAAESSSDFTLLLETTDGRTYGYSRGTSTPATTYESASTSKLVTAVVILELIDQGTTPLTLDSRPQDFIPAAYWPLPADSTAPASRITLRHLLAFTSGFMTEPTLPAQSFGCLDLGASTIHNCVRNIYNANIDHEIEPGSRFHYSSTHLQIAGLMAMYAAGLDDSNNWNDLFLAFKNRTHLFSHSTYALPSTENPRLAGGMNWTAEDYMGFLRVLHAGTLLSSARQAELWANQRGSAIVDYSPLAIRMGEDWGYGLGNWVECRSTTFNCGDTRRRNSSPGAYGAYPFIDVEKGYFGIVAQQNELGNFPDGVNLFRSVQSTADAWAANSCSP